MLGFTKLYPYPVGRIETDPYKSGSETQRKRKGDYAHVKVKLR